MAGDVGAASLTNLDDFRNSHLFSGIDGRNSSVVILDTGIDLNHSHFGPDNDNNGISDRIVFSTDFSGNNDNNASAVNSDHGSHVSSIVATTAPGVNIIHLKVFPDGANPLADGDDIEEALQWVVDNREEYNIVSVNMSLGSGNFNSGSTNTPSADELDTLNDNGVIVVTSSGNGFFTSNSAQGVNNYSADPNTLSVGAVYDGDIGSRTYASGASDTTTAADRITSFTQRHSILLDIFAPGAQIEAANSTGGTTNMSGTSMAAPFIAGTVALAQQLSENAIGRRLTLNEMTALLKTTGALINDGDDEQDNVVNTGVNFRRVDVYGLGEGIWTRQSGTFPTTGNDNISGRSIRDYLAGFDGNDTIIGNGGNDDIHGKLGNDSLAGGEGNDYLVGGEGNDFLGGWSGNDNLNGEAGNDSLYGDSGVDTLSGGDGNDLVYGHTNNQSVINTLGPDNNTDYIYAGAGNDTAYGGNGNDFIGGWSGNDNLNGEAGNDSLYGDSGVDTLSGGDGNDVIYGHTNNQSVINTLGPDNNTDYIYAGAGNDTAYGGNGNDFLGGWSGNDNLNGEAGNDSLYGDSGVDTLNGGDGNDVIYGHTNNQSVINTLGPDNNTDYIYAGAGNDTAYGGNGNDFINGWTDNDNLNGEAGDDSLHGDSGSDTLYGGDGNDALYGFVNVNTQNDPTIDNNSDYLFADGGNDTAYGANGDDYLEGSSGNDTLYGENHHDTLIGGTGSDFLNGGAGNDLLAGWNLSSPAITNNTIDSLTGGDGNDVFVLGVSDAVFYTGDNTLGFAIINDLAAGDKIQLKRTANTYYLDKTQNFTGANTLDTGIFTNAGDLIGVIKDNTTLVNSMNNSFFAYV